MYKPIATLLGITFVLIVLLPAGIVGLFPKKDLSVQILDDSADVMKVKVYLKESKKTIEIPLEEYVKGVAASEMPVTFEMEALKAQAIVARTNVIRRVENNLLTPEGGHVTDDFREFQAYSSNEKLKQIWGASYEQNMKKIVQAVKETKGQILVYQGKAIEALFFSTSNGLTENSLDYWGKEVPYLSSVPSPWDKQAPRSINTKTISLKDLFKLFNLTTAVSYADQGQIIQVLETSSTNRVKKIRVGDKVMSGAEFRKVLGLNSTDFSWSIEGNSITFTTRGFGHGVGMSQYGAEGMAKEGKKAFDILTYFYKGATIVNYEKEKR
ncbi:stage II sporulation protein D [Effusibacillus consociatus]|uniref:Stage II sporulation protein D n=1 Tax=Effusibacillus consociatus TaxID=1117041 RepID=A0ABV9Q8Q5_9BACL